MFILSSVISMYIQYAIHWYEKFIRCTYSYKKYAFAFILHDLWEHVSWSVSSLCLVHSDVCLSLYANQSSLYVLGTMCVRVRPCVHKGPWCSKHKYQLWSWLASLLMPLRPQLQQIPQTPSSQKSQRLNTYCTWRRPQWAAHILCPMTATCSCRCSPTQNTVPTQPHHTSLKQVEHCILFLNWKCGCYTKINNCLIWNVSSHRLYRLYSVSNRRTHTALDCAHRSVQTDQSS